MELIFQMVQLIASGQISQIGANALNPVKEVSKTEKDQFCYCPEMGAGPVVEILEKKENAMNLNVHVGFKKISKRFLTLQSFCKTHVTLRLTVQVGVF